MNKVRELIVSLPRLSGVVDHAVYAWENGEKYDAEAHGRTRVYDRRDEWTVGDRLRFFFHWLPESHDYDMADYGRSLVMFAAMSIDQNNGAPINLDEYESLKKELASKESAYPEISSILSVKEAEALLGWVPSEPANV